MRVGAAVMEESMCDGMLLDLNCSWDGCIEPIDDVQMCQALTTNEIRSDINSESNVKDPEVGMTFPSWDAVDSYYHARVSKGKRVVVQSPIQRSPTNKTTSSKKCECPAMVYAKPNKCNEWELCTVVLEHKNHTPTPSKSRHIPKYRNEELNKSKVARNLFNANAAGVSIAKIHRTLVMERNGFENLGVSERDVRNVIDKKRRLKMEGGDANAMLEHFDKIVADNQNFYHRYRLDDDGNLKDVMWVDARCRAAYEEFGDVVSFDSTYLTNKSELPFTNFVGVNHHGQTILLGCALVSHEDVEAFTWLFSTWMLCMNGKAPGGILTDQDAAMRKALSVVMPQSRHRWCIWHILKKFSEKLRMYSNYKDFKSELLHAIYDSFTEEEFEKNWTSVIMMYELQENQWLSGLFDEREMWVPAYMRHLFLAGMKTTQRSESIHSFFDGYVSKTTRLCEFPQQYSYEMEVRANEEKEVDANCWKYTRTLLTAFPFEAQFRDVYTDAKFKEVQVQCSRVLYVTPLEKRVVGDNVVEHLLEDIVYTRTKKKREEIATMKRRTYCVWFDIASHDSGCECKHFECYGIMCCHLIKVYYMYNVEHVPSKFILRRWRKDIQRKHMVVKVAYHDLSKTAQVQRFDKLMVEFERVCLKASLLDVNIHTCMELIQLMDLHVEENNTKFYESARAGHPSSVTPESTSNGAVVTSASANRSLNMKLFPVEHLTPISLHHVKGARCAPKMRQRLPPKEQRVTLSVNETGLPMFGVGYRPGDVAQRLFADDPPLVQPLRQLCPTEPLFGCQVSNGNLQWFPPHPHNDGHYQCQPERVLHNTNILSSETVQQLSHPHTGFGSEVPWRVDVVYDYGDDCQQVTYKTFRVQDLYNVPTMERWNFPTNTPIQVLYERWAQNYNEDDRDLRLFHEEVELDRAKTVGEAGIGNGDIIYVHVVNRNSYASNGATDGSSTI
ncbi:Protein FAR-RED IMPAIRED RESPONSE 1 [Bienertia sinuspersici]